MKAKIVIGVAIVVTLLGAMIIWNGSIVVLKFHDDSRTFELKINGE